jgi:HemY protein
MRAGFYALQVLGLGLLVAFALTQTGTFEVTMGGLRVYGETSLLLLVTLGALVVLLFLHRIWVWVVHFPRTWARYRREINLQKGHQALTRSLQALAANDTKLAFYQAQRAQKLLPDFKTVPTVLVAATAQAQGHTAVAELALQDLMSGEARDLAVRGLIRTAVQQDNWPRALEIARTAAVDAPRVMAVQRLAYDLECQMGEFPSALKRLSVLERRRGISRDQAAFDRVRLLTACARAAMQDDQTKAALKYARKAYATDPSFVPAACVLIDLYRGFGRTRRALGVLAAAFAAAPHPDLLDRHEQMAPQTRDVAKRIKYHEKFLLAAPQSAAAQLFMAKITEAEGLWHQARAYLLMAEKLDPRQGVYQALARFSERQGDQKQVGFYLEQGMTARPDPVWVCTRTQRTFDQWEPLVMPEHFFGSVQWVAPGDIAPPAPLLGTLLSGGRLEGVVQ